MSLYYLLILVLFGELQNRLVEEVVDFHHRSGDDHKWLHFYRFREAGHERKEGI